MRKSLSIDELNNQRRYFFNGKRVHRKTFQKINSGTWSKLSDDEIERKFNRQTNQHQKAESFKLLYGSVCSTKERRYLFGIAQEKSCNLLIDILKKLQAESRELVRRNRTNHDDELNKK